VGRLIYSMMTSLDGYVEDRDGRFGWGFADEEVHRYAGELVSSVGTYLYGRRMYDIMVYWETIDPTSDEPPFVREWAGIWQAAEKVVYSRTLAEPRSARTRIERTFDPEEVRRLKLASEHDLSVEGPELAAQAIEAGLVDEFHTIVCPVLVGGGRRFFPDRVELDLDLIDERRFGNGVVALRHAVRRGDDAEDRRARG
jgi:dihydrofolate reductase